MSRELPRRPSLDHLKKQAKELLHGLRQTRPDAALTDAQHMLAREYGFASWPKLKAHVEAAAAVPPPAFHRFTHRARQALFFSRFEAAQAGSPVIEPAHMLLGLMRAAQDLPRNVFAAAPQAIDTGRLRAAAAEPLGTTVMIPFGDDVQRAMRAAIAEADALRHERIGLAHLVMGLLHERESPATAALHDAGLRLDMVRHAAAALMEAEPE